MAVELYKNPKYLEINKSAYIEEYRDPDMDGFLNRKELEESGQDEELIKSKKPFKY